MPETAGAAPREWDIFVSYAHEDAGWVQGTLYPALQARRTADGRRPVIFLDTSRTGINPGKNVVDALALAVQHSHYFLAVYTASYFDSTMCNTEVTWAFSVQGERGTLVPLLFDPSAEARIPFKLNQISWLSLQAPDWFDRLSECLGLAPDRTSPALRFADPVDDVLVGHTLPPVEVTLVDRATGERLATSDPVTLGIEPGKVPIDGTLEVAARAGVAAFRDLSIAAAGTGMRLVATAPGCEPVPSTPFDVVQPPDHPKETVDQPPRLAARGVPVFFADGKAVAVLGDEEITVFTATGGQTAAAALPGRPRLWSRSGDRLAVADWSGHLVTAHPIDGTGSYDLGTRSGTLAVPGALCFDGDRLYVGMWDGSLWLVTPDRARPTLRLRHPAGIQALGVTGERLLVAGLDGSLAVYDEGSVVRTYDDLEPLLLGLRVWPGCTVVVGEQHVYQLPDDLGDRVRDALPLSRTVDALVDGTLAVAVDPDGRGVRFDAELTVRAGFHAVRGARPLCTDDSGDVVAFAYPNGQYVLMVDDRVIFVTTAGPLAVSPDGQQVALDDIGGIRLAPLSDLVADP